MPNPLSPTINGAIVAAIVLIACVIGISAAEGSLPEGFEIEDGVADHGVRVIDEGGDPPVFRFEVAPGDCVRRGHVDDCALDRERAELTSVAEKQSFEGQSGDGSWYRIELFIPEDFTAPQHGMGITLFQLKVPGSHPALDLFIRGSDDLRVKLDHAYKLSQWDHDQHPRRDPVIIPAAALRGRWHDVRVHAHWSEGADGFIRLYVDGELLFTYLGQNVAEGDSIYVKFGIYRWDVSRDPNRPVSVVLFRNPGIAADGAS